VRCSIETDAMFSAVEPILPRVPGEFHGDSCIYDIVYTFEGGNARGDEFDSRSLSFISPTVGAARKLRAVRFDHS
jgi:hypothetical protein